MCCVNNDRKLRSGFTLVELLVVIAIVILLLALLLPTIGNALATRRTTECANRLRQIGAGLESARRDGETIRAENWTADILPHVGDRAELLFCPEDVPSERSSSYGMSTRAYRLGDQDGGKIAMLDYKQTVATLVVNAVADQDDWSADQGRYAPRHLRGVNALLHTGGVKPYQPEDIDPRVCELWKRYWRPQQDRHQFELDVCAEAESSGGDTQVDPDEPFRFDEPSYPPEDLNDCGDVLLIADDQDSAYFSEAYDPSNNYTDYVEVFPGFVLQIDDNPANFRYPYSRPEDLSNFPNRGNYHHAEGHQNSVTKATFEFRVDPGEYSIWLHWPGHPDHADNSPIEVLDGETVVRRETLNQEQSSEEFALSQGQQPLMLDGDDGEPSGWYPLGEFEIGSDRLRVVFSAAAGAADGFSGKQHMVVADAVRVQCSNPRTYYSDRCFGDAPPAVDDDGPGFTSSEGWQVEANEEAYDGSQRVAVGGSGDQTATYEFTDVVPGKYHVWTFFVPKESQASNTPFTVYDGNTLRETVSVNQQAEYLGMDLDQDGKRWYMVGSYDVETRNVRVVVSNNASDMVVADAVRIECAYNNRSTGCMDDNYEGRACRKYYAEDYGATDETERAVEEAVNWLSRHQYEGGHWSFKHGAATCPYIEFPEPCHSECGNEGSEAEHKVVATGMALLPFLGAGFGPEHHKYGHVVAAGVNYLLDQLDLDAGGTEAGAFPGDGYDQGMGSLALLEALGVCRLSGFGDVDESELTQAAEAVVRRIVVCQHDYNVWPNYSGGWRYGCGEWTDMSVSSWMVQALKAASTLGIDYEAMGPLDTMHGIQRMLSTLGENALADAAYGSQPTSYYYLGFPGRFPPHSLGMGAAPQIGRYLSLITGASPRSKGMARNAEIELARTVGGMERESYRNYYANSLLRHVGGTYWPKWEESMHKLLLEDEAPETTGHIRGSWFIGDQVTPLSGQCGRLWETVAASLCLEVYYRDTIGQ